MTRRLVALFFVSLIAIWWESTPLENTLGGDVLFAVACAAGAIVAVLLRAYVWRRMPGAPFRERLDELVTLAFGLALLSAAAASFVNRSFPPGPPIGSTHVVSGAPSGGRAWQRFYIRIEFSFGSEKLEVSREFWASAPTGTKVNLWFVPGRLGFAYLDRYELAK